MTEEQNKVLDCLDVAKLFPDIPLCCSSCHNDWEAEYGAPLEVELGDGRVAYVCCVVRSAIAAALKGEERDEETD